MKNEGGREAGKCSKMVPDRGDRCLFTFLSSRCLFCNVFPFPVCKAQLKGDKHERAHRTQFSYLYSAKTNGALMHPAPLVMADQTWRTNFGAPCLVSIAYWRRGTSLRQYIGVYDAPRAITIGGPMVSHLLLANRTKKNKKNRRTKQFSAPRLLRVSTETYEEKTLTLINTEIWEMFALVNEEKSGDVNSWKRFANSWPSTPYPFNFT